MQPRLQSSPGNAIENVTFRNVRCDCIPDVPSVVAGYDADRTVHGVRLENVTAGGKPLQLQIGEYATNIQSDV